MDPDSLFVFAWFGAAVLLFSAVAVLRRRPSYWPCAVLALMSGALLWWMRFRQGVEDITFIVVIAVMLNLGMLAVARFWVRRDQARAE